MNLEERINSDLKDAMKAKDQAALRTIRSVKSAILLFKTDGTGAELDDEAAIKMVQKLVKQRQDSLDIYEKQGREDLAVTEREEIEVLKRYLPKQLSEDELTSEITSIIKDMGASGMKDMGKVMAEANQRLAGKADGKTIASIVKNQLT
ncbi:MAG TPA: GatB/YqeY domain-containing protein [Saprospiraceae bacterium]|nr:GatB/YqeY domain-containing protein [Saprospiraceae bacterium]MCB9328880.1 GatB/YqeY domain-containing protein [Lewinellaceae bacterium]HPQ20873.1 GatB/YqeY domain-containing protein [Saprospiraceae bacterium]